MVLLNVAQMQVMSKCSCRNWGLLCSAAYMATPVNMFSLNVQIPILELAV